MRIEKQHHCDCNCIIDNTTIVTNYVIFTVKYTVYLEGESKIIDQTEMIVCPNGVGWDPRYPRQLLRPSAASAIQAVWNVQYCSQGVLVCHRGVEGLTTTKGRAFNLIIYLKI